MKPSNPPPSVRPYLMDKVHAALVKAGRPVTRSELRTLFLKGVGTNNALTADVQAALNALAAEGLAVQGEERGKGQHRWQIHVVWRATRKKG